MQTQTPSSPQVAIFLRTLAGGGAERVMVNLANYWAKEGCKVDLVLAQAGGPYLADVSKEVNIIDLGCAKSKLLPSILKLTSYLRNNCPKALLSALHYTCEVAVLARYLSGIQTRVVVSEHNTLSLGGPRSREISARFTPIAARVVYPFADGIVACSNGVANDLSKLTHIPRQRVQTIYNPFCFSEMLKRANEFVAHPWFAKDSPPVILAVGRLVEQKDYPTLLRAVSIVQSRRNVRLVILGQGRLRKQLESLAAHLGIAEHVAFLGFVDNPLAYMTRSKMLVSSSAWEGLSNVLVEALAVGTPVISTDCPNGPREVLDDGKYGKLVPVGDAETMATAIESVLEGYRCSDPTEWLKTNFSIEVVATAYRKNLGF